MTARPIAAALAIACGCTLAAPLDEHRGGPGAPVAAPPPLEPGLPPGCDATRDPRDEACIVADEVGVFVSPTGDDAGPGTRAAPLRTIRAAIEHAGRRQRVFLCGPRFDEAIALSSASNDRKVYGIYGGFACDRWGHTGGKTVIGPASGYPLRADGITSALVLEDLELRAADGVAATDARASSVAAYISGSAGVLLKRVALVAGRGADAPPAGPPESNAPTDPTTTGNSTSTIGPGALRTCTCMVWGSTRGAIGGDPVSVLGGRGADGAADPLPPPFDPSRDGAGGARDCATAARTGAGGRARAGGAAAEGPGAVDRTGWRPSAGAPGLAGDPGQGGGGGGLDSRRNRGGGGGGCGGCGGGGGKGGAGGGASIGLLAIKTPVALEACTIATGSGGAGAAGGAGEPGRAGGAGGNGGCPGAKGGPGAGGSGGAGGAGGLSIGVLFEDPPPVFDGAPIPPDAAALAGVTVGAAGRGGPGGPGGAAPPELDGVPGQPGADGPGGFARAAWRRR